jgi:hypothetical protein
LISRQVALSVIMALVVMLGPSTSSARGQGGTVCLTVHVGVRAPLGAQSAGAGGASQPVAAVPLDGVEVRVMVPGTSSDAPLASATTDAAGDVRFDLAPGTYWVFVPRADPPGSGPLGAVLMRALPDGTLTPAWAEIDLSDGNPATLTLTATQLNP